MYVDRVEAEVPPRLTPIQLFRHFTVTDNESSSQLDGQHKHLKTGSANTVSPLHDFGLHSSDPIDGHDTSAIVMMLLRLATARLPLDTLVATAAIRAATVTAARLAWRMAARLTTMT